MLASREKASERLLVHFLRREDTVSLNLTFFPGLSGLWKCGVTMGVTMHHDAILE